MNNAVIDISIHGTWFTVPAVPFNDNVIAITGKWLKVAVIHDEEYLAHEFENPEACITMLKEERSRGRRADIFTFAQWPTAPQPKFAYPMEWDSVAVVRTTSFKQWWESLPQEGRKNVRRAEKRGVVTEVKPLDEKLIADIHQLNNDSSVRQGRKFVHFGKTLEQVRRDQAAFAGRSDYICSYVGDELIGFCKIVYRGDIASLVQFLPKASHNDKRPANALLAKAVERCESKGMTYLTYGKFNYGNRKDTPLRQFKTRNGFEEILVPRFYVPLTLWGTLCAQLKLYRGLIGILPDRVVAFATNLRAKWYDLVRGQKAGVAQW